MKKETAKYLTDTTFACSKILDESLRKMKADAEPSEYKRYCNTVSKLLTIMLVEVENPAFSEHPDLKPPGWVSV